MFRDDWCYTRMTGDDCLTVVVVSGDDGAVGAKTGVDGTRWSVDDGDSGIMSADSSVDSWSTSDDGNGTGTTSETCTTGARYFRSGLFCLATKRAGVDEFSNRAGLSGHFWKSPELNGVFCGGVREAERRMMEDGRFSNGLK